MPFGEWAALKATSPCYAGGLPVIEVDGAMHTQSLAIIRWAGKAAQLYPAAGGDGAAASLEALRCDAVMDTCADALNKCPGGATPEAKKAAREEYAAGKLKSFMEQLNAAAVAAGGERYIAGGAALTVADLVLFYFLLDMLRRGQFDHVPAEYADDWPALAALEARIRAHPIIAAYKKSLE